MRSLQIMAWAAVAGFFLAATWPARAQSVPTLNVDPVCRGIAQQAATPGERGGPDLGFKRCVRNEQAMRRRLVRKWSAFTASEKANCVGEETAVSLPSYTDLVTCLQMAKEARALNGR